ncbi:hypothetical protein [Kitasatospora griseola]|uniref:hypothetical protein n=1 Tax=Kitasatospora griseola TaxID=2064 RepID=UPI00366382A3
MSDPDGIKPGQTWLGRYQSVTATVTVVEPKRIGFILPYSHGATSYLTRRQFLKAYLPPRSAT